MSETFRKWIFIPRSIPSETYLYETKNNTQLTLTDKQSVSPDGGNNFLVCLTDFIIICKRCVGRRLRGFPYRYAQLRLPRPAEKLRRAMRNVRQR